MEFSEQLDALEQRVAAAKTKVQAAATESREQIGKRIDQAQSDLDRAATTARQQAEQTAESGRSKWAQIRADVADKRQDIKA